MNFAFITIPLMKGEIIMITLCMLLSITLIVLFIGAILFSIGGSLLLILFSDIIVAISVIWFLFFRKKSSK